MNELALILEKLETARCPEQIFGNKPEVLKPEFYKLLRMVHPDLNADSKQAHVVTEKLNAIHAVAVARVAAGTYGKCLPLPEYEEVSLGYYKVLRKPIIGASTDVYISENHVLKAARSVRDNDLLHNEQNILRYLQKSDISDNILIGLPVVVETFQTDKRRVNVLLRYKGFYTAEQVHAALPHLEGRTLAWMFKRILVLLEWVHHCGILHGAVLPPHLMFYPDNDGHSHSDPRKHAVRLLDWCYAIERRTRTRLSSWEPLWAGLYAPEIILKEQLHRSTDIYMAAKCMLYLAGNTTLPRELQAVLDKCTQTKPSERYRKAGDAFEAWQAAIQTAYGAPKWIDFNMPK